VRGALEGIASEHAGRTVVAVCHAGVIQASIRVLFAIPHPGTGARLHPSNTGMTTWERDEGSGRWTLRTFNDDGHLRALAPTA
jgi:probable phosphoglycerate mutase